MSQFPPAFDFLMNHEDSRRTWGVAQDNNGGGVIAGINSKSFPRAFADLQAMPQASRGPAISTFYQQNFWNPFRLGGIESQDVANRALDMAVNAGPLTMGKLLQEAANAVGARSEGYPLAIDGLIGAGTLAVVNEVDPESLLAAFREQRMNYYTAIAAKNPADAPYLAGWLARAQA